jgi:hypothetical protein
MIPKLFQKSHLDMILDRIETVANYCAIFSFLMLTNWLILLVILSWQHLRRVGKIKRSVEHFLSSVRLLPRSEALRLEELPRITGQIDESDVIFVISDAIKCLEFRRTDLSELRVSLYINSLRPTSTWFLLQNIATDAGMFFTVVGTSLAFARVASMKSPMDLLLALQLALLTTVAGLSLKVICVFACLHPVENSMSVVSDLIWGAVSETVMTLVTHPRQQRLLIRRDQMPSTPTRRKKY